jgi:hypothetical protein
VFTANIQRQLDVLRCRQRREEVVGLEHKSNMVTPDLRKRFLIGIGGGRAAHDDFA